MTNPKPDFEAGSKSSTPVPRLDATSSRLLILSLLPQLSTIPPPHHASSSSSSTPRRPARPFRALDCGAGIGRVTSTVLLPLFDLVDLVEPVPSFVKQAKKNALRASEHGWTSLREGAPAGERKAVRIWKAGLQHFDPTCPGRPVDATKGSVELFAQVGRDDPSWPAPSQAEPRELNVQEEGYDLIMIQWCIGHLSDDELVAFLKRSRAALRQQPNAGGACEGYILLKENVCKDETERLFDDDDSSYTRSDKVFREIFERAGLTLYRREVQQGFPEELFPVIAYALR
ncbi:hypothetical protein B0A53_01566 [Rhodotorula sp. CCFEE 5036]|nr:hypothetical protein B0A53_01566 [Rhodotorula sp. CCFEE 5036]